MKHNEPGAPCAPSLLAPPAAPYTGPRQVGEAVTVPPIYPPDGSKPLRVVITGFHGETHFDYRSEDDKVTGTRMLASIIEEGGCNV